MSEAFKRGEHVAWNSEAGRVRSVILKKAVSNLPFQGYVHHASKTESQYFIASEKMGHVAIHKDQALRLISPATPDKAKQPRRKKSTSPHG